MILFHVITQDRNSSDIEEPKEDRTPTPPPVTTPVAPEKSNKKKAKKNKGSVLYSFYTS